MRYLTFAYSLFFLSVFVSIFFALPALAASGDVAISGVLFDPEGADTGLEYVTIKNFGKDPVDLSRWDLYPDGVGYFTFPAFILEDGASVKVHVRQGGANDTANLFFPDASGNIGNSSGSLALFSDSIHGKDTIVSYVRYHKLGSAERKTWETSAASAGIWKAGVFIDISSGAEGKAISLSDLSKKNDPNGWELIGNVQAVTSLDKPNESIPQDSITDGLPLSAYTSAPPEPKIKAYAGEDRTILAGAETFFEGYGEGLSGGALDGARFLWNFGDGAVGEGKKVFHSYRYPGNYTVYFVASSGIYTAPDVLKVTVIPSPLIISEIKPADTNIPATTTSEGPLTRGWIEIVNNSIRSVEITGFGIQSNNEKPFYFPQNSFLASHASVVLGFEALGFSIPVSGEIKILYPNGSKLFTTRYPAMRLDTSESLNFLTEKGWVVTRATPGEKNETNVNALENNQPIKKRAARTSLALSQEVTKGSVENKKEVESAQDANRDTQDRESQELTASIKNTDNSNSVFLQKYGWLIFGVVVGIGGGILSLIIKNYLSRKE